MTKRTALVNRIMNQGKTSNGNVQVNSKGVKYRYDHYVLDTPSVHDVRLFEDAKVEEYGKKPSTKLKKTLFFDNKQIVCQYPVFVGEPVRSLGMQVLVILQ